MDNLSFCELVDSVGRSDVGTSYHADEYARSRVKQRERERVLDFVINNHPPFPQRMMFLGMPGEDWTFEQMLLARRPDAQFVGVERSATVYARARRQIPVNYNTSKEDTRKSLQDRQLSYGTGYFPYSRIGNALSRKCGKRSVRSNRLLMTDIETYLTAMALCTGPSMEERKEFVDKFYRRTAAWIDFVGTLTPRRLHALSFLPVCFGHPDEGSAFPVVLTVQNCRDSFHGADERVAAIRVACSSLDVVEHWTYAGKGAVSMLTVCGLIK